MKWFFVVIIIAFYPVVAHIFFFKWLKLSRIQKKLRPKYELLVHLSSGKVVFSAIDFPIFVPFTVQSSYDGSIIKMYFDTYEDANKEMQNLNNKKGVY